MLVTLARARCITRRVAAQRLTLQCDFFHFFHGSTCLDRKSQLFLVSLLYWLSFLLANLKLILAKWAAIHGLQSQILLAAEHTQRRQLLPFCQHDKIKSKALNVVSCLECCFFVAGQVAVSRAENRQVFSKLEYLVGNLPR